MDFPLFVSACLVGFRCRYDGKSKAHTAVLSTLADRRWFPVCPEQMAGLTTPRSPIFFVGGTGRAALEGRAKIVQENGAEVTPALYEACRYLVRFAKVWGIQEAILKERSPSCGVSYTYVGDTLVKGEGIFTAMLQLEGIGIRSEEAVEKGMST